MVRQLTAARVTDRATSAVALSSTGALIEDIRHARSVDVATYALRADSALTSALSEAAAHGADVHVRLGQAYADPGGDLDAKNAKAAERLRASGVDVTVDSSLQHLKAAVVDGTAFFDDRNWVGGEDETVISDGRRADVAALRDALRTGHAESAAAGVALSKPGAARLEADVIGSSGRAGVDVQSETITDKSRVEDALVGAAQRKERVRLIVSLDEMSKPHERDALEQLSRNGVQIHIGISPEANEKFCVAGNRSWVGSANATWEGRGAGSLDWGLRTDSRTIAATLHDRFEQHWKHSVAYVPSSVGC